MSDTVSRKAIMDKVEKRYRWQLDAGTPVSREIARELAAVWNDIKGIPFSESEGEAAIQDENEFLKREYMGLFSMYERLRAAITEAKEKEWELAGEPTPVYAILHAALSTSETGRETDHG